MHPVADKIRLDSFEGQVEVLGQTRTIAFLGPQGSDERSDEKSSLTIVGLTLAEAWEVISRLHGPVAVPSTEPKTEVKAAEKPTTKAEPKPEPKAEVKATPKPEPESETKVEDGTVTGQGPGPLDLEFLSSQQKLRPVLEHMIDRGLKTVGEIVKAAVELKDKVPAFRGVDENAQKGGSSYEKRIERNADILIGGKAS